MKRFARLLGILGGIGAIVWAMRDRFISLTVPREPEPPAFRSPPVPGPSPTATPAAATATATATSAAPEPSPSVTATSEPDDLTEVNGVGPVFAGRLATVGIATFAQLAAMTESELAEALGSRVGKIPQILKDAKRLAAG